MADVVKMPTDHKPMHGETSAETDARWRALELTHDLVRLTLTSDMLDAHRHLIEIALMQWWVRGGKDALTEFQHTMDAVGPRRV